MSAVRGAAVADRDAGRDALAAQTRFGGAVEDELDGDEGGDRATQPADERGRRCGTGPPRHRVEQVRAVDEQPVGGGERVAVGVGHRAHATRERSAATIGS